MSPIQKTDIGLSTMQSTSMKELRPVDQALTKPNIVSRGRYPATTHPQSLRSALSSSLRLANKYVVVADGPASDAGSSSKIIEGHPLKEVCNEFNVALIDVCSHRIITRRTVRGFALKLLEIPAKAMYTMPLPLLKTHFRCHLCAALKNQFGYLPRMNRIAAHMGLKNIHKCIAEINVVAKPDFFIEHAVHTMLRSQQVRHGAERSPVGQTVTRKDPVALDAYALTLVQKPSESLARRDVDTISYIKLAERYEVSKIQYTFKNV